MAQVYVPDDARVREQIQSSTSSSMGGLPPTTRREEEEAPRRLGGVDVLIVCVVLGLIALLVVAASRWVAPLTPKVSISLAPNMLPAYAGYSMLRMMLAYILSLIFTLAYGHFAATRPRAGLVMVPLLDILQSIPVLSFLPAVVLALVAAFPHSNIGLELASVLLIFTGQAWNMTFSFYHSARTLPKDLQEFSAIANLRPWQRFLKLEVPSSMIGLIWNSMMSWAGGWFFLMASEQFVLGDHSFQLPGLGSYLQAAANAGDTVALFLGLGTLIVLIILINFFFWRPLVAWADKFKLELGSEADPPTSPVLSLLRHSALVAGIQARIFRPLGDLLAGLLNRLQPLPSVQQERMLTRKKGLDAGRLLNVFWLLCLLGVVGWGLWNMVVLLAHISFAGWGRLFIAAGATWLRTLAALLIGVAWTLPLGVAIGLSPRWSKRLQPVVQVVASIPATAFFPILLPLLVSLPGGLSLAAIVLMLLGTQWYVLFNVIAGAMAIPNDLKEAATTYQVTGWRRWRVLILPGIFPYLVTGLLTASGGAWNASIVSEYVQFNAHTVQTVGLGAEIAAAATANNFALLLAATLLMAAFVVVINRLLWKRLYALAERRYTLG
ncbi:ABC transporter permease [Ktedonobacter racemifer]|uniref:Binding-protein-dependent transport systems inner membrane component n=1 Tax=Ktedonobacter racemifer DSM 44963 TaxID=485913 RepID=D6U0G1_KTERA|nr:ABC transporter permease subunit [Ktedonobacter racemifer]EFH82301.1 binding-protein-dependent transport systems inner membrane component [Ktedonobacter racemifer DSM 44963]